MQIYKKTLVISPKKHEIKLIVGLSILFALFFSNISFLTFIQLNTQLNSTIYQSENFDIEQKGLSFQKNIIDKEIGQFSTKFNLEINTSVQYKVDWYIDHSHGLAFLNDYDQDQVKEIGLMTNMGTLEFYEHESNTYVKKGNLIDVGLTRNYYNYFPTYVYLNNLTGDNSIELVVGDQEPGSLYVFKYISLFDWELVWNISTGHRYSRFVVDDFTGNGIPEIVVVNSNLDLLMIEYDTFSQNFEILLNQTFEYEPYYISSGDVNNDGSIELITLKNIQCDFYSFNGASFEKEYTIYVGNNGNLFDGDNDGNFELFSPYGVFEFDSSYNYTSETNFNYTSGISFALGNVDFDDTKELIVGTASSVDIYDIYAEGLVKIGSLDVTETSIERIYVYDINQDGKNEIIFTSCYRTGVISYVPFSEEQLTEGNFFIGESSTYFMTVGDIDNDGIEEILINFASENKLKIFELYNFTLTQKYEYDYGASGYYFSDMRVFDIDMDGQNEILTSRGYIEFNTGTFTAYVLQNGGSYFKYGDINNDGEIEYIVYSSSDYFYYIYKITPTYFEIIANFTGIRKNGDYTYYLSDMEIADVDGDGLNELIMYNRTTIPSAVVGYSLSIGNIEGLSYVEEYSVDLSSYTSLNHHALYATDLSYDGVKDIIITTLYDRTIVYWTGAGFSVLSRVFEGYTGFSGIPGVLTSKSKVADLNNDGQKELVIIEGQDGKHLNIYEINHPDYYVGGSISTDSSWGINDGIIQEFDILNTDEDSDKEIIFMLRNGTLCLRNLIDFDFAPPEIITIETSFNYVTKQYLINAYLYDKQGINTVKLYYSIDGQDWQNKDMSLEFDSYSSTIENLSNNSYIEYYITATDIIGLYSVSEIFNDTVVFYDKMPPFLSNIEGTYYPDSNNYTVTVEVYEDNGVDAVLLYYSIDSEFWNEITMEVENKDSDNMTIYQTVISSIYNNSFIKFYIYANDTTGLFVISETYSDNIIYYDNTSPVVTKVNSLYDTKNNIFVVSFLIEDTYGIDTVIFYYLNSTDWCNMLLEEENGLYTASVSPSPNSDTIQYYVWVNDTSGLFTQTSIFTESLAVDINPPLITNIEVDPEKPTESDNVVIYAKVFDEMSEIQSVFLYYKINNEDWNFIQMSYEPDIDRYYVNLGKFSGETTLYYYINATDIVGNTNITDIKMIEIVDATTSPITSTEPSSPPKTKTRETFTLDFNSYIVVIAFIVIPFLNFKKRRRY